MSESREIYLAACRSIAEHLQDEGFRLLKSKHYLVKTESDLTFRIRFQSDFRNALSTVHISNDSSEPEQTSLFLSLEAELAEVEAFGSVSLFVHAEVAAKSIQSWRTRLPHPVRTDDVIAGSEIGQLAEHHWLTINLANPRSRSAKVAAVVELIRTVAFPYFDEFRNPSRVVEALTRANNPGMSPTMGIEYAACYGSKKDASRVLNRILSGAPDWVHTAYREALQEFRRDGLPAPNTIFGNGGADLVFAALALGLQPITPS